MQDSVSPGWARVDVGKERRQVCLVNAYVGRSRCVVGIGGSPVFHLTKVN